MAVVTITHWYGCGYPEHAALLAKEIRGALDVDVTMIAGGDERELTVRVDDRVVLTRRELRFVGNRVRSARVSPLAPTAM